MSAFKCPECGSDTTTSYGIEECDRCVWWAERAAILEFEAGLPRDEAERRARVEVTGVGE